MANTILAQENVARITGATITSKILATATWTLSTYGLGSRYTGNTLVAEPLCYGIFVYFDSAYTNNGSSGVSDFKCYVYMSSTVTGSYIHMFHIIAPQGSGLPTSSNLTTNPNALFGIQAPNSYWTSCSLRFVVTLVSGTTKTTDFANITRTWINNGGRMYITINSSTGAVYAPAYYSPSTTYANGAKSLMASGITASDIDCKDQTHILRG